MRDQTIVAILLAFLVSCASAPRRQTSVEQLPLAERDVLAALFEREAVHPAKPRPIIVLSPTDPWMPTAEEPEEPPADVPPELWAKIAPPLPQSLRDVNRKTHDLTGIPLPSGIILYRREQFEKEYESEGAFRALVQRLGGTEPLVLSVSRPSLEEGGDKAHVLLHVLSTWSGCGGINQFVAIRSDDSWDVELAKVLVVW